MGKKFPKNKNKTKKQKKFHFHKNNNNNLINKQISNKKPNQTFISDKNTNNNNNNKKSSKEIISSKLSENLDDTKFRILNEKLYKSSSTEALNYFQSNSEDFITYHKGFSFQAKKWPLNPNDLILKTLLLPKYKKKIIVDIGCGEATLAKNLIPLGYNIKSFDLFALNNFVTVADMKNLPIDNNSIDLAIYCLSLMNKNFIPFIVEANRILKKNGKILVGEISSRIVEMNKFLNIFDKYGFHLIKKRNLKNYFFIFTFVKIKDCIIDPIDQERDNTFDILKPCLYKKR